MLKAGSGAGKKTKGEAFVAESEDQSSSPRTHMVEEMRITVVIFKSWTQCMRVYNPSPFLLMHQRERRASPEAHAQAILARQK